MCGIECFPTPPIAISLAAGQKYDIKVEYRHPGGRAGRSGRARKLKVMAALAETPREVIPVARLFAPAGATTIGTGINAAYFSDAAFSDEYLAHVEPTIDFHGTRPPVATRASGLVCNTPGGSACGASDPLGAPAVLAAETKRSAGGGAVAVEAARRRGGLQRHGDHIRRRRAAVHARRGRPTPQTAACSSGR